MHKVVKQFDSLANLFEHYDWNYTRKDGIKHIRYTDEFNPYDRLPRRIKRAFGWLLGPRPTWLKEMDSDLPFYKHITNRISMFLYVIKRDANLPDGALGNGKIIVFWEEDGEYLQYVQPSVGALLAKFLKEDPDNPHAAAIIDEMKRINQSYRKRIKNKEVD